MAMQRGITVWLTGLSGAGKTTICRGLEVELLRLGCRCQVLDGDIIRKNLCQGLGFNRADREENIRRIVFVSSLLTQHDVIVLVSAISPYRQMRQDARQRIDNFLEVYVNAPLAVCEARDVKGLYRQARAGEITQFTGIDDPYEAPESADVVCFTDRESVKCSVGKVMSQLRARQIVPA